MIHYSSFSGPFGQMAVAASPQGVVRVLFPGQKPFRDYLEKRYSKKGLTDKPNEIVTRAVKELETYFDGKLKTFTVPIDLDAPPFYKKALMAVYKVPYGTTVSYKDIAVKVHNPQAVRAVGSANANNPIPIIIPCHRIISHNGDLGGYGGRLDFKVWLLELEKAL